MSGEWRGRIARRRKELRACSSASTNALSPLPDWSVSASKVTVIVSPAASGTSAVVVDERTLAIFGRPLPQFTVVDTGSDCLSSPGSQNSVSPISFSAPTLQRTESVKPSSTAVEAPVAFVTVMTSLSSTLKGSHTAV